MNKIVVAIVAILSSLTFINCYAQEAKYYINDKEVSLEILEAISADKIESMSNSVVDGIRIIKIKLKNNPGHSNRQSQSKPSSSLSDMTHQVYLQTTIVKEGDAAPEFSGMTFNGKKIKLSDYKGKVVLLNFWATWCGPCLKELSPKELPKAIEPFQSNNDFIFITIAYTDTMETLGKFFKTENGKTIYAFLQNSILDSDKSIFELYAKQTIPRLYVIDRTGHIAFGAVGATEQNMVKTVEAVTKALEK